MTGASGGISVQRAACPPEAPPVARANLRAAAEVRPEAVQRDGFDASALERIEQRGEPALLERFERLVPLRQVAVSRRRQGGEHHELRAVAAETELCTGFRQ